MPGTVLRGAFIGFGNVALHGHLPGWLRRADVEIVAATDTAKERRELFLKARSGGRWYDGIDEMFAAEELDFVDICTPPASHAALACLALKAGAHVLCEKPLVIRAGEMACPDLAHGIKVETGWERPVMHWIAPGQHLPFDARLLQDVGGAVAMPPRGAGQLRRRHRLYRKISRPSAPAGYPSNHHGTVWTYTGPVPADRG